MSAALQLVNSLSCPTKRPSTSFCAVPNKHYDDVSHDLQPRDKTTYDQLYRLSYGWGTDTAWISVDRLAERVCVSRNTIRDAIKSLESKQKITVLSRGDRGLVIKVHPLFDDDDSLSSVATLEEEIKVEEEKLEALPPSQKDYPLPKKITPPSKIESRGSEIAPIKKTELKKEANEHTVVCADDGPLITTKNFEPLVLSPEHVHPLANLSDKAISAAYKISDKWTVLRVIFTFIISYLSNKVSIANPVALLSWALKNKLTFVASTDKEIKDAIIKGLNHVWSWLMTPAEKELWAPDKIDIQKYIKWLQSGDYTLKEMWEQYFIFCPALSKTHSLLFFVNVRPNPVYLELKKVREMHGEYWHRD